MQPAHDHSPRKINRSPNVTKQVPRNLISAPKHVFGPHVETGVMPVDILFGTMANSRSERKVIMEHSEMATVFSDNLM
jgi:hypothetical protein